MNEMTHIELTAEEKALLPQDPTATHPREIHVTGKADSVAVINGRIWHGGTRDDSGSLRRVLHLAIGRRDIPQQLNERVRFTSEPGRPSGIYSTLKVRQSKWNIPWLCRAMPVCGKLQKQS